MLLVLLGANERDVQLGDLPTEVAELGFRTAHRIARGEQLVAEIDVALLARTDELSEAIDLGGRVVGRSFGHGRRV